MAVNSKKKGSKNENQVAKLFQAWTGHEFTRTPSSGGLRWKKTDNIVGDIVCTTEGHYFPISVEVKFHKEINFSHLLLPNTKVKILEFWEQALDDAKRAKKIPLLMMRYNGMPKDFHFLCIDMELHSILLLESDKTLYEPSSTLQFNNEFVIIPSSDFFNTRYKKVRRLAKRLKTRRWV